MSHTRTRIVVAALAISACNSTERVARSENHAALQPSRAAADSLISAYLNLSTERDRYDSDSLARMRAESGPCIEEMYGDGSATYWLAHGRLLGYDGQIADTLKARLELLVVAEQRPATTGPYDSRVIARVQTDTVTMRLVPDGSRRRWQVCGHLSTGLDFGGYGRPQYVRYDPPSVTREQLLRQVDSIQRTLR